MKGFEIYIKAFLKHDNEYTAMEAEKREKLYRRWQRAVELSRAWGKEE